MDTILNHTYFGNTLADYAFSFTILIVGFLLIRILKNVIIKRLNTWAKRTKTNVDEFIVENFQRSGIPALYYVVLYSGVMSLHLSTRVERIVEVATAVVVTFFVVRLISSVILMLLKNHISSQEHGAEKVNQLGGFMIVINIFIWILGGVFLIDNLGYDVTAIVTGLGIGGIAVALAAQNILGDLFNYFVIFFDRPFEVGDFIIVDDKMGTVEYIGIKTTRIRSLSGEQLIIGNSNLMSSRIHNCKRQFQRRVVFTIDVDYNTSIEKLKLIPELFRSIVLKRAKVTFDRAHIASYREWSVRYEIVYMIQTPDFNQYMDIQQAILFEIHEAFDAMQIRFAIPRQLVSFQNGREEHIPEFQRIPTS